MEEYRFETEHTLQAVTVMVRTLRKTLRGKQSRRARIGGWLLAGLAFALSLPLQGGALRPDLNTLVCWAVLAAVVIMLLFEDVINAFAARLRIPAKARRVTAVFRDLNYTTVTEAGRAEFYYNSNIRVLAETRDYFVLVFDASHGQIYDKKSLAGGTPEAFKKFLENKLGREFIRMK